MKQLRMILMLASLSACSAQLLERGVVNEVKLVKVTGRVIRYNCDGAVTSDRTETLQSPSTWLEWEPEKAGSIESSRFYNRTTRDYAGLITGLTKFQVTIERGQPFSTRVVEGLNDFDYEFLECLERGLNPDTGDPICVKTAVFEEGQFQINVTYEKRKKTETTEYSPTPESCREQP